MNNNADKQFLTMGLLLLAMAFSAGYVAGNRKPSRDNEMLRSKLSS